MQNIGRSIPLILKSVKCRNKKIFVTEIFKVKIVLSPELMNDIFEFIEKPSSWRMNSQFWPEDPNEKVRYRNRKIWHRIFFQMNKAII